MPIVIQNGKLVTALGVCKADLRMEGGVITAIGQAISTAGCQVVDASGHLVLPGAVDPHTHLDMPFGDASTSDDFRTGTIGALMGGVTSIVDFAIQKKGATIQDTIAAWHKKAEGRSHADYAFHVAITDCHPGIMEEMARLPKEHGISTVKLFMAYKGLFQVDDGVLLNVFKVAKEHGILVQLHCENGDIISELTAEALKAGHTEPIYHARTRPSFTESEAIHRAATLAKAAGAPMYVVHLSSKEGLQAALTARHQGQEIYLETCPQYLLLDEEAYEAADFGGAKVVMSPPLRNREDRQALWEAISRGLVDVVATDHCAFNFHGPKQAGKQDFTKIPNGAPGLETRLPLLYTHGVMENRITLPQMASLLSTRPAQLMGMYPRKGAIAIGSDADLVIYDPGGESRIEAKQLHGDLDYTPFEGFRCQGAVRHVFLRGKHVVANGRMASLEAGGVFIRRESLQEACHD